jgi:predicted DNA-binding transcriptional regulator AlpA
MSAHLFVPPDAPNYIKAEQLARWFGVSGNTIRNWAASGRLPQPVRLSTRTVVWVTAEVREFLANLRRPVEATANA